MGPRVFDGRCFPGREVHQVSFHVRAISGPNVYLSAMFSRCLQLPTRTGIDSFDIQRLFSRLPKLGFIVRSDPTGNHESLTLVDIAPSFRYGSVDWKDIAVAGSGQITEWEEDVMESLEQPFRGCRMRINLTQLPDERIGGIDSVFNDVISLMYHLTLKHDSADWEDDSKPSHLTIDSASLANARAFVAMVSIRMSHFPVFPFGVSVTDVNYAFSSPMPSRGTAITLRST